MTRRAWLAALGIAAAALVAGVCITVAYGLSTGFDRAAGQSDLADILVRFDPERRADVDKRLRTLPGLEARSYRYEATGVDLSSGGDQTGRGVLHVVARGRRGYAVVEGRDARPGAAEVVVEQGLRRSWGLRPGARLRVGRLGTAVVVGVARVPDNVAFPVASTARVYVRVDSFEDVGLPVNVAQVWLRPGASTDVALAQARAQSYGIEDVSFITREGVRTVVGQAAGIVVALLVAFSLVALGAAAAMLGTAAHADVQRRLSAFGVQRALGFPRRNIVVATAARAARVAVPAAALGLAAGWALAAGPAGALLDVLNQAPPGAAALGPLAIGLAAIVVLVVACSAWPAWAATRRTPAALLRGGELAGRAPRRRTPGRAGFGLLGARLVLARRARYAGGVAVIGGCAAVVLLMLALASLLEQLRDDPAILGRRYQLTTFADPSEAARIRAIEGVRDAAPRWRLEAASSFSLGERIRLLAYPGDHLRFEAPPLAEGRRLAGDDEAEVGAGLADALGLAPGATLGVQLPNGEEARFRVSGVVRALENDGSVAYVRPARLRRALGDATPSMAIRLDPGADRAGVARRLAEAGFPASRTGGASGRNAELLGVLGDVLRVVAGAVGLVILYALAQALALIATERRATLALLRSLGGGARTALRVLAGAGLALVVPAALLAIVLEQAVLAPLVADLAAGYADLPLGAGAGQALLVAAGLIALAALAAAWTARRAIREPIAPALRERP